jgi:hypothetical protein
MKAGRSKKRIAAHSQTDRVRTPHFLMVIHVADHQATNPIVRRHLWPRGPSHRI